ncbi:hypothetical protein GP486_001760 [Trichoglossum hirsutum]|uniref:Uncharacterized protein n=1 Tax=Trichoglossum hirsutum TaxID=265104 RepID=A0A9P8LGD7_9PEZI|nr:hypothetical protein GP486_001760 [Trichoglossum hirsutum]
MARGRVRHLEVAVLQYELSAVAGQKQGPTLELGGSEELAMSDLHSLKQGKLRGDLVEVTDICNSLPAKYRISEPLTRGGSIEDMRLAPIDENLGQL